MAKLFAHRGAPAERPENTLASFERALQLGANVLELDVHPSRDGEICVSHDPSGLRMCGVSRELRETKATQIQRWDAGWGFELDADRPFANRNHRIPLLREVLSCFPNTELNIDIKHHTLSFANQVVDLLAQTQASERVTLASFSHRVIGLLRKVRYPGQIALCGAELAIALATPLTLARKLLGSKRRAQIPLRVGAISLDRANVVQKFHRLGIEVDYWTVNDAKTASRLLRLGADGIMSDDPKAIRVAMNAARCETKVPSPAPRTTL